MLADVVQMVRAELETRVGGSHVPLRWSAMSSLASISRIGSSTNTNTNTFILQLRISLTVDFGGFVRPKLVSIACSQREIMVEIDPRVECS